MFYFLKACLNIHYGNEIMLCKPAGCIFGIKIATFNYQAILGRNCYFS